MEHCVPEMEEKMRAYIEFGIKKFQNKMAYRMEVFMGILNTILTTVIFCSIYKALYGGSQEVDGITFGMVATNFMISLGLSGAFSFDEMFLQNKVRDGSITGEFLKPVNFKFRMLAENVGESAFKIVFHFIPAVVFIIFYTDICLPDTMWAVPVMCVSVVLGYLVLWEIAFIVQTWCFWLFSTWGIMVIKNVFINVLAGSMLPIWFMPEILRKIISYTPFEAIYFTPVRIYLGQLSLQDTIKSMIMQAAWVVILYVIGDIFWKNGIKKLVVQGG